MKLRVLLYADFQNFTIIAFFGTIDKIIDKREYRVLISNYKNGKDTISGNHVTWLFYERYNLQSINKF